MRSGGKDGARLHLLFNWRLRCKNSAESSFRAFRRFGSVTLKKNESWQIPAAAIVETASRRFRTRMNAARCRVYTLREAPSMRRKVAAWF